jgi:hypothetical protein
VKNYIFVGCDSHEKTLVNKIAHNDGPLETKRFSARRAGRQKLIENLRERSRRQEGAGGGGLRSIVARIHSL